MIDGKKILDVTCGDRTIWFQKNEPHTIYCDKRREEWEGLFGKVLDEEGKTEVHHKNGDKMDNRAENLEWIDRKEHAEKDKQRRNGKPTRYHENLMARKAMMSL